MISVCMVVKNEAERIAPALCSVLGFKDLVVVDHGCTDDTIELCRSMGARIFDS